MSPIEQIRAAVKRVQKFHRAWCDEESHDPKSTGECQIAFWAEQALMLAEALNKSGYEADEEALASVAAKVAPERK